MCFTILYWQKHSPGLVKVKIIPEEILESVLFNQTKLEAKILVHFPRYIPTMEKKKNPTRAS